MSYHATAKLEDGRQMDITGTITECAEWADNLIRANGGAICIDIRRADDAWCRSSRIEQNAFRQFP